MDNRTIISCTNNLLLLEKNCDGALCSVSIGRNSGTDTLISSAYIGYQTVLPDIAASHVAVMNIMGNDIPLAVTADKMLKNGTLLATYSPKKIDMIGRLMQQAGHLRGLFALDVGVQDRVDFLYRLAAKERYQYTEVLLQEALMLISTAVEKEMANG